MEGRVRVSRTRFYHILLLLTESLHGSSTGKGERCFHVDSFYTDQSLPVRYVQVRAGLIRRTTGSGVGIMKGSRRSLYMANNGGQAYSDNGISVYVL